MEHQERRSFMNKRYLNDTGEFKPVESHLK